MWIGHGVDVSDMGTMYRFMPAAYVSKHRPAMEDFAYGSGLPQIDGARSLQGRGIWMASDMPSMAPFVQGLINVVKWVERHASRKATSVVVKGHVERARSEMRILLPLLDRMQRKGRALMCEPSGGHEHELGIFTDSTSGSGDGATKPGFGVLVAGFYIRMEWPPTALERATNPESGLVDNTVLELMARAIGVKLARQVWPAQITRKRIKVFNACDNTAAVGQSAKMRARNTTANDILIGLACEATLKDFIVEEADQPGGVWVPTKMMFWGDPLSRSISDSREAQGMWLEFLREVDYRPIHRIIVLPDAAIFDWRDPFAVVDYVFDAPCIPPYMLAAWQPSKESGLSKAERFLKGVSSTCRRSRLVQHTSSDGHTLSNGAWVVKSPGSSTPMCSPRVKDTALSGPGPDTCSELTTSSPRSTNTLATSSTSTESSSKLKWSASDGPGGGGADGSTWRGSERQIGPEAHPKRSSPPLRGGAEGEGAGGAGVRRRAETTTASLEPFAWLSSLPCAARSIPPFPVHAPAHYSYDGGVYVGSRRAASSAGGMTPTSNTWCARSTGKWTGEPTDNGCLCTVLATKPYVQSRAYDDWQGQLPSETKDECAGQFSGTTTGH